MKLTIRVADARSVELEVLESTEVRELRSKLSQHFSPPNHAELVHCGHVLNDEDATLLELGIRDGDSTWAVLSPSRLVPAPGDFSLEQAHRICPYEHVNQGQTPVGHDVQLVQSFIASLSDEVMAWSWSPSDADRCARVGPDAQRYFYA